MYANLNMLIRTKFEFDSIDAGKIVVNFLILSISLGYYFIVCCNYEPYYGNSGRQN